MQAAAHVTHEAIQKIGGIGAVLHGLLTSKTYLAKVPRNILIGPFWPTDHVGDGRLGPEGEVIYSSLDGIRRTPLAGAFEAIARKYGIGIVYGRRRFSDAGTGVTSSPEVLLLDVASADQRELGAFKFQLWERFGIDSGRYEDVWDYEQYVRIAAPAIALLHALGAASASEPCFILSHEYMGMPTALAAILDGPANGQGQFRTIFHAHECAPMRRIVEGHAGHDTMFYNVMASAMAEGKFVEDVFGDQSGYYKHALVKASRYCDNIFAVGDATLREMRFLGADFLSVDAQVAYNGVPHWRVTPGDKAAARGKLLKYCNALLGYEPTHVFTHVTRLVPSKGLWRDLRVLEQMEPLLRERGETAVLFTLSTEVPGRRPEDVLRMEEQYKWPVAHREGGSDLSGGEAAYYAGVQEFNARSRNAKVVFINQFGFDRRTCGKRVPEGTEFMDIRKGSDAEFGQSIYEPFGIAQVEPISFGGICVYTNVCGCAGFVSHAAQGVGNKDGQTPNAIVADYTTLPERGRSLAELLLIGKAERDAVERHEAARVAAELLHRLPRTPAEVEASVERGFAIASRMSWDAVAAEYILPGFERAMRKSRLAAIA